MIVLTSSLLYIISYVASLQNNGFLQSRNIPIVMSIILILLEMDGVMEKNTTLKNADGMMELALISLQSIPIVMSIIFC